MDYTPGNTSFCLVLGAATGNSSLSEVSQCWECEEPLGFSDQLVGNLSSSTNCTECLENVCTDFVAKQNWNRSRSLLLVAAFMGVLMLLGIPGNIIVLVVYYFKTDKTTANKFMMALASIDLHACLIIHPYIISKLLHFYSPTTWICKIFEYLLYVSQGSQGLMLMAVAVDRYYAVFKPFAFGFTDNAAYMIPMTVGVGAALSIPIILFYGQKTVWLYDQQREVHIRTHVCHYSDDYDGSRDQFIFVICTLLSMLLVVTVISILYILIAVKIRRRNAQVGPLGIALESLPIDSTNPVKRHPTVQISVQSLTHSKQSPVNSSTGHQKDKSEDTVTPGRVRNSTTTSLGSTLPDLIARPNEINLITALDIHPIAHCSSSAPPSHTLATISILPGSKYPSLPLSVPDQPLRVHRNAAVPPANIKPVGFKGCKLLLIVTTVFFLSWLPFWVLRFVTNPEEFWTKLQLSNAVLNHLFFLNNAVNPILYAFTNRKFCEECRITKKKISTRLRYMCC